MLAKAPVRKQTKPLRAAQATVYGTTTADYGPSIRRHDVHVPARARPDGTETAAAYTREATAAVVSWPDPDSPDRRADISGAATWLPFRFYREGKITSAQIMAASRYRDNLDMAAGVSGGSRTIGVFVAPWSRALVSDMQIQAAELIRQADTAIGRDATTAIRAFVSLDTLGSMALAIGVSRKRVMERIKTALDDLDTHLSGHRKALDQHQGH